jgi:hypothetical protein
MRRLSAIASPYQAIGAAPRARLDRAAPESIREAALPPPLRWSQRPARISPAGRLARGADSRSECRIGVFPDWSTSRRRAAILSSSQSPTSLAGDSCGRTFLRGSKRMSIGNTGHSATARAHLDGSPAGSSRRDPIDSDGSRAQGTRGQKTAAIAAVWLVLGHGTGKTRTCNPRFCRWSSCPRVP